jgi:hypothetical protein
VASGAVSSATPYTSSAGVSNTRTFIDGIARLNDGRAITFGDGANLSVNGAPTYWFQTQTPIAAASLPTQTGAVNFVTPSGLLGGFLNNPPAVGKVGQAMTNLPGALVGRVLDASTDDVYLVGSAGIYQGTPGNINSYTLVSTSSFATPATGLAPPDTWAEAEKFGPSGTYIVVGDFLTESFGTNVAGYNPVTGALVFSGQEGDSVVDARTYGTGSNTVTIVLVQGTNGPAAYLSNDGFQTRVELGQAFGATATVTALPGTMNELGLGFIANVNGVNKVVSFGLTIDPVQQVIQVDTMVRDGLYPAGVISTSGGSTFQFVLYGAADFNVRNINLSTLTVSIEGITLARVGNGTVRDYDLDGIVDRLFTYRDNKIARVTQDRSATLEIKGKLTGNGTPEFNAAEQVTLTRQNVIAFWHQLADGDNSWLDTIYDIIADRRKGWRR